MDLTSARTVIHGRRLLVLLVAIACGLAPLWATPAGSAHAQSAYAQSAGVDAGAGGGSPGSASLVQCLTASEPAERSATFAGEMSMIAGAARMALRIELLERAPGEDGYHPVLAPGVGVWHTADPGVKVYKHLEQFTDLSAPAYYRALITFRWQGPHGHIVKRDERRTPRCAQPAPTQPSPASPAPAQSAAMQSAAMQSAPASPPQTSPLSWVSPLE